MFQELRLLSRTAIVPEWTVRRENARSFQFPSATELLCIGGVECLSMKGFEILVDIYRIGSSVSNRRYSLDSSSGHPNKTRCTKEPRVDWNELLARSEDHRGGPYNTIMQSLVVDRIRLSQPSNHCL